MGIVIEVRDAQHAIEKEVSIMVNLNAVSETALLALKARVIEAEKQSPVIHDAKGREMLNKISSQVSTETQRRVLNRKLPSTLTSYLALRARKYDSYTKTFIKKNPKGLVVNLGCGFDTRYWRVSKKLWNYIEIDLPEVIEAKKEVLGDNKVEYEMIGCSVLDMDWIEQIASKQKERVLFLAEGLFMYLPEKDVVRLFKRLAKTFSKSQIVFEIVAKKYTKGFGKKIVESKMKRNSGTEAGASFNFGIKDAKDIESYARNIEVMEEWSYFEEPDIRPRFQRLFRHFKSFSRTLWTISARIG